MSKKVCFNTENGRGRAAIFFNFVDEFSFYCFNTENGRGRAAIP